MEPPKLLLRTFSQSVTPILTVMHILRLKNANLRSTRDLLLPKLVSGEIDVEKFDVNIAGGE